jgi:hypothetical protein
MDKKQNIYGITTSSDSIVVYAPLELEELIKEITSHQSITFTTLVPTDFEYSEYGELRKFTNVTIFCNQITSLYSLECEA